MYCYSKTSKRNVKSHAEYNKQIPKGVKYLRVSNGTIGPGARHTNLPLEILLKDFTLEEITTAYWNTKNDKSVTIPHPYETEFDVNEGLDSIPF